jgi:hypothetical protein
MLYGTTVRTADTGIMQEDHQNNQPVLVLATESAESCPVHPSTKNADAALPIIVRKGSGKETGKIRRTTKSEEIVSNQHSEYTSQVKISFLGFSLVSPSFG